MVNKAELVSFVAKEAGLKKKDAENAVNAFLKGVKETLGKGEKVALVDFGTFEAKKRSARKGKNPQTGEEIIIPETVVPCFKPGKKLKEAVKGLNA